MSQSVTSTEDEKPVRQLGRGLRAKRGVHMTLRGLRDAADKTQSAVAEEAQMDQADVSRLESRMRLEDCYVATLQRYLQTIGGDLELVAIFGNKRIILTGVEAPESEE